MPIPVKVYTWPPGGGSLAINELDLSFFDFPPVGSRYCRDRDGFTIREVDETTDPVTVHLEHSRDFENELRGALPDGYWLDGGRSHTDGEWHFSLVQDGVDRPIGLFHGDSLEEALDAAVSAARTRASESGANA